MNTLILEPNFLRQIESAGVAAYPNECCGIMFGRDVKDSQGGSRIVERLMPVKNHFEADEQHHRFSISPKQLMDAEKSASVHGQMVLGFYHSHPDHPAKPSEYDREHAWPFYSYVIVAITKGEPTDMTSWLLHEETGTFSRQNIIEAHGETNEPTERNLIEPLEGRDPM